MVVARFYVLFFQFCFFWPLSCCLRTWAAVEDSCSPPSRVVLTEGVGWDRSVHLFPTTSQRAAGLNTPWGGVWQDQAAQNVWPDP